MGATLQSRYTNKCTFYQFALYRRSSMRASSGDFDTAKARTAKEQRRVIRAFHCWHTQIMDENEYSGHNLDLTLLDK